MERSRGSGALVGKAHLVQELKVSDEIDFEFVVGNITRLL